MDLSWVFVTVTESLLTQGQNLGVSCYEEVLPLEWRENDCLGSSIKSPFNCDIFFVILYSCYYLCPKTEEKKKTSKDILKYCYASISIQNFVLSSEDNNLLLLTQNGYS
jgi:hypothetical protein